MPVYLDTPTTSPSYVRKVQLDGVVFKYRMTWRDRTACWYMDLLTLQGVPIVSGRRVSPGSAIIPRGTPGAPPGIIFCDGSLDPYAFGDLGASIRILYYSAEERAEFEAIPPNPFPTVRL